MNNTVSALMTRMQGDDSIGLTNEHAHKTYIRTYRHTINSNRSGGNDTTYNPTTLPPTKGDFVPEVTKHTRTKYNGLEYKIDLSL